MTFATKKPKNSHAKMLKGTLAKKSEKKGKAERFLSFFGLSWHLVDIYEILGEKFDKYDGQIARRLGKWYWQY